MRAAAALDLSPGEREDIGRALGRLLGWLMRELHLPWWGGALLLLGLCALIVVTAAIWERR